jgi:hypothetical protein
MNPQDIGLNIVSLLTVNSVLLRANPVIAEFFSSNLVIFLLVAVYSNKMSSDKNMLVSLAIAFFAVILVKIITLQDFNVLMESFELIYPGPNSSPSCLKVTKSDLVSEFGNEGLLKKAMIESSVPMNMELNDVNSPEIATYLVNNPNLKEFKACKLI